MIHSWIAEHRDPEKFTIKDFKNLLASNDYAVSKQINDWFLRQGKSKTYIHIT